MFSFSRFVQLWCHAVPVAGVDLPVLACLQAMPVHPCVLCLAEWQNVAPGTVRWAAGEYRARWTQFHLKGNWRTGSHLSRSKFASGLHSVRWNRCSPPSNFEMRTSRPRGLSVARAGLPALRDISRDPSPSVRVYLPVDCSTSLLCLAFTRSLSLNIDDQFI